MAGGINHAKQTLIAEANELSMEAKEICKQLKNGKAGDIETISKAISLLVKDASLKTRMLTPIFEADFVTTEDCKLLHTDCQKLFQETLKKESEKPEKQDGEITEVSIGSLHIKGKLNVIIVGMFILAVGVGFAIGKTEGWW